jgi:hypothetical protein
MNLQNYPSEIDIDIQEMRSIFLNVAMNIKVDNQNISENFNQIELKLGNENANQIFSWWQQVFSNNGFFEKITLQEILFRTFGTIICVAIILSTLIGNILVIVVVTRFHRMRTVTNILLARYFINGFINDLINFC